MLIVAYDISNDRLRTKFAKFLNKFGHRLQYSVFKIKNSERILDNVTAEIKCRYEKKFTGADSVMILRLSPSSKDRIIKFGYAKNMDSDIIFT